MSTQRQQVQPSTKPTAKTTTTLVAGRNGSFTNRPISIALSFGLSVTLFIAMVQVFDPSLDEHIHLIKQQKSMLSEIERSTQQQQEPDEPSTARIPMHYRDQLNPFLSHHNISHLSPVDVDHHNRRRRNAHAGGIGNNHHRHKKDTNEETENTVDVKYVPLENTLRHSDRIYELLSQAGITQLPEEQVAIMPKWDDIVGLYGNDVIILGKERCQQYRDTIPKDERIIGVAGMFNTGTNYLDITIANNIYGLEHDSLWQVPWGKHRMSYVKNNHTAPTMEKYNKDAVLPIVVIRDPYSWMQSMCKAPYSALWRHKKHHCPNLVFSPSIDHGHYMYELDPYQPFPVTVKFDEYHSVKFTSLIHLWMEWYQMYLEVDYPTLMIRYEDLIFQPNTVLKEIGDCAGANVRTELIFQVGTSKEHGSGTDYIKAIIKTANTKVRMNNMTMEDYDYAIEHLSNSTNQLMETFSYKHPPMMMR